LSYFGECSEPKTNDFGECSEPKTNDFGERNKPIDFSTKLFTKESSHFY